MRQLLVFAAVAGLALARPETYREKEDFQFSRSSTDEGTRSGYYGAQRGNMGGNYERSHNMDPLAQNQMSGLVQQVEGELGDGAQQKIGSVYTAANSRGTYGSGHYDLSNLEGRNFQETGSYGDSLSHSSLTSSHGSRHNSQYSANNAGLSSNQGYNTRYNGGYNSGSTSGQYVYSGSHRASGDLQSATLYDINAAAQNYDAQLSKSGYQGQAVDQESSHSLSSNGYGSSNIHSRLVSKTPVRIIIRPGTTINTPVAAQTYDASQSASSFDRQAVHASSFDQNAINSEAEVLNNNDQQIVLTPSKPKHYESSYSYRKEWEKQDTKPVSAGVPLPIPTVNPYPVNSELYDYSQGQTQEQQQQRVRGISSQNHHSSHSGYDTQSASSNQYRQQAYNANADSYTRDSHNTGAAYNRDASGAYNGAYTNNAAGVYNGATSDTSSLLNQVDSDTKPKSYQSSYSYHKSWEHQGDPYVIVPTPSAQLSTGAVKNGAYQSQHGSHHQSHQRYTNDDCDENGHIRVARSYNSHQHQEPIQQPQDQSQEDLGQQTQQLQWDNLENLGQQRQNTWDRIEDLGQKTQQVQFDNLDNLGQQSQNSWERIEDLGQKTQQAQFDNLDELGQQSQRKWDNFENLGQQAQSQWDQQVGQETQNTWDKLLNPQSQTDLGQQTREDILVPIPSETDDRVRDQKPNGPNNSAEDQNGMNKENTFGNAPPNKHHLLTESHTLEINSNKNSTHHSHSIWDEIKKEEIGQENEDSVEPADLSQQTQITWGNFHQDSLHNTWHQQSADKDQSSYQVNSGTNNQKHFMDMPNPHPWMYNQVYNHNSDNSNLFHSQSSQSSYSGSQAHWLGHSSNTNSKSFESNAGTQWSGSASGSVSTLWDKLDQIEKDTILSRGIDVDSSNQHDKVESTTPFNSQAHRETENDWHYTHNTPLQSSTVNTNTTTKPIEAANKDEGARTHDVLRGDIPDNLPNDTTENTDSTPFKTPERIEPLSVVKETEKPETHIVSKINKETSRQVDDGALSVMSLEQQYQTEHQQKQEKVITNGVSTSTTSITEKTNYNNIHHGENDKESRDIETQFENQGQQDFDQQFDHFGQQSESLDSKLSEQQFENFGQADSFHQHHKAEDFGQQNEQFDQASLSGWQQGNQDQQQKHQPIFWEHQNTNLEQQSQSGWNQDSYGQVQGAWEPTEDLQQHSQITDTFDHVDKIKDQQSEMTDLFLNREKLESQQSDTFGNAKKVEEPQSQITDTFEHGDNMNKHYGEDLGQQDQHFYQASFSGSQPDNQDQQMSQVAFWGNENLNQQSQSEWNQGQTQAAWEPTEDLQQHSQLTDTFAHGERSHSEDMEYHDQAQTEDLQQQSKLIDTFSTAADQNKETQPTYQKTPEVSEELIVPKKVAVVESPPDEITEKPGFWKSVGGKLSSAKDKVKSWFSS